MEKRTSPVVCLALAASLWMLPAARADIAQLEENPSAQPESELLLTNTTDIAGLYLEGYNYPIGSWVWAPGTFMPVLFQPMTIVWADTANLPTGLAGITNYIPTSLESVNAWPLWVTLWPQSNTVTVLRPWSDETLTEFSVPDGFPSWEVYEANLRPSCILFGINYTNWETLVEEGYTQFSVPMVITHAWLMDVASRDVYWANYEADCEAAEAATASTAVMGSRFMPMDDEDPGGGGGGDPCTLTNLLQQFSVTRITAATNHAISISFQSCQFFRYLIFSANSLSTNTIWLPQAYVWGATNASSTTWTDTSTTNNDGSTVTQRFYRVQRILGNAIAAGDYHGLAVTEDPTLWTWGDDQYGELGGGLAGPSDSSCTGYPYPSRPFPGEAADVTSCLGQTVSNAVAVAGGDGYSVVADAGGTVWTAGLNGDGQLGNGSTVSQSTTFAPIAGVSNVVSVAAGADHALALRADGTVWAWGNDTDDADDHPGGVLGAGSLPSSSGSTNVPIPTLIPSWTNIVAIAAGWSWSLALDTTGQLWGWGDNEFGEIGTGVPVCDGCITNVPVPVAGISNVIAMAAGDWHAIAITADKTVWTWGDNEYQQLGRSVTNGLYDPQPTPVPGLSNVVAIGAAGGDSYAVTSNGWLYAWGANGSGQLGTNGSAVGPMYVPGISNVVLVTARAAHALAMTLQGGTNQYYGWGANDDGQVGNGTNSDNGNTEQDTPAQLQFCTRCQREVQLGTSGSFTAQCNGTLYLYFNTDNFGACAGQYNVTFGGLATNVPANADCGIAVGTVTNGQVCTFTASGFCTYDIFGHAADPNGNPPSGPPADCSDFNTINITNAPCPTATCFSLVGRIQ